MDSIKGLRVFTCPMDHPKPDTGSSTLKRFC